MSRSNRVRHASSVNILPKHLRPCCKTRLIRMLWRMLWYKSQQHFFIMNLELTAFLFKPFQDKLCNYLPRSVAPQCVTFVDTYSDMIIDFIVQGVTPEQVWNDTVNPWPLWPCAPLALVLLLDFQHNPTLRTIGIGWCDRLVKGTWLRTKI